MSPRLFALLLLALSPCIASAQTAAPDPVSIAVFSLFHPATLILTATRPISITLDSTSFILPSATPLTLHQAAGHLTAQLPGAAAQRANRLDLLPATFTLTVPGKLTRTYVGALTVTSAARELQPIVCLPLEAAVASILAAEAAPHASPEALKAQAIVARSFLLATPHRHTAFTACDTTHCQYLREAPPASSSAARATRATAGFVLTWQGSIVPAMYSRSCGGQTHALSPPPPASYPFFAVSCRYCQRHPELWSRPRPTTPPVSEKARIAYARIHGWDAIPSTTYRITGKTIQGRGTGHGIGLCQLGAEDLARRGETFPAILAHFFPATTLTSRP